MSWAQDELLRTALGRRLSYQLKLRRNVERWSIYQRHEVLRQANGLPSLIGTMDRAIAATVEDMQAIGAGESVRTILRLGRLA